MSLVPNQCNKASHENFFYFPMNKKNVWGLPGWSSGLRLHTANVGGMGSIPSWGTKIPHATWHNNKNIFLIF